MLNKIKGFVIKLVGIEAVVDYLVKGIARGIGELFGRIKADIILHELGLRLREVIPGDEIEEHIGHLVGSFKKGLLGMPLELDDELVDEEIKEELDIKN